MKTLRFLILGLLATTTILCRAQQFNDSGWYRSGQLTDASLPPAPGSGGAQAQIAAVQSYSANYAGVPTAPVAEVITPDIQALADGLQDDPLKIFNYVHDHIRHVLYFGAKKGAEITLLEKSGNDFDQCALLVALLRAAGYTGSQGSDRGVGYQFGWELLPYDSTNQNDLHHWLGLTQVNTNWSNTTLYLYNLFYVERHYPTIYYSSTDTNTFWFQRVWVTLTLGSTNYYLDPSFKISQPVSGINLSSAMGFGSNNVMSTAAGTDTGNYVTNLNETALRSLLTGYTTNLLNYIQNNCPNSSVQQILGGWQIVPSTNTTLATGLLFPYYQWNQPGADMPVVNWQNEPTNLMSSLTITFAGTNHLWSIPQLEGQRISLTFDASGTAQLWQDDSMLAQRATSGTSGTTNVVFFVNHPFGFWNFTNNVLMDNGTGDQVSTNSYQRTNSTYAILYAFEPDWGWLQQRENVLDNYLQQGLTNGSRQVLSETLNVMGLNWMLQTESAEQLLAQQMGVLPQWHHRIGRMAQEAGKGYYVDVYAETSGELQNGGTDNASIDISDREFDLFCYFGSALEHGIIEQLQNTNLVAASTVKMLQLANANGQAIYMASSTNWTSGANISGKIVNYDSTNKTTIGNFISNGYIVLLPQNGSNHVAGAGSWAGCGYAATLNNTTNQDIQMRISGGYHGGYVSDPNAGANVSYVDQSGDSQPQYFASVPIATPNPTGADPVDMADGTFQIEHTDLSIGQSEPRGITLTRYYNGTRRYSNPAGMADGWMHNYSVSANTIAAPQAGLGGTTPAQAAPMMAATFAAIGIFNDLQPDPKNWMVTALIAKWGVDQLSKNGVSANLGKDTVQFVQQPNGVFTPPANCTMTLTQSGSAYVLQERHGRTFNFNTAGQLSSIVDPYGNTLTVTWSSNVVSQVSDWKGRSLNFTYTGNQLTTVADNSGRSIAYAYSNPNNGDLISFTDTEGKSTTYTYDTNHDLTATIDPQGRLVVSNNYNSFGRVTTQYTGGNASKLWQIFWSGWQTVSVDPAGGQNIFSFDNQKRLTSRQDALGNLTQSAYDGQNHVVMTVSPMAETNQFIFDGNNNLIYSVDPLGFTNQFVFDNQNNLIKKIDQRGNASTFGYNTQFTLTGATNGAGDWVNYAVHTDGTPASQTDASGTTTFGQDGYGQLNLITYPDGSHDNFANSVFGDVTNHADARGFSTAYQYNSRREPTNTIAPTNITVSVAYDVNDNVVSTTDSRGNATTNLWSATHKLLATIYPTLPQGAPVTTNIYDNRDWLSQAIDPMQHSTQLADDLDGNLLAATDPLSRTVNSGHDADGRVIVTTNAIGEVTRQQWDKRGHLVSTTDAASHTVGRAYDGAQNQVALTNRNGNVWRFQFDGANRLTNTISPLGHSTSQAFNQGLLASVKDPAGHVQSYSYNSRKFLTSRSDNAGTTTYVPDANGNVTAEFENGLTNSWTFDAYNRVSSYRDPNGFLTQYRRDADGAVTNIIYPGNLNVYYTLDSHEQVIGVMDWTGRQTTITRDLNEHITSITRPNGTQRLIGYDTAGETTNIIEEAASKYPIAFYTLGWANVGRMAWEFGAPLPHTNAPPSRTMTYDADNELLKVDGNSVMVDTNGNLISGPLTNDTFATYSFDARNRLQNVGGVTNVYDAMNNRIGQIYGTNAVIFVVDPNGKLPQVLMRIKNGVTNYYIYGAGLLYQITQTATNTSAQYYHSDYRGSTVALTDDNGNITDRMEYSLYGTLTYRAGANDTPFLFNGKYGVMTDPNGLLYMRARYYNPFLCRFLNPDPAGFSGGLNFYAYANGNPVSYLDPFGLWTWGEVGSAALHFGEGVVVSAAVATVVVLAAPEIAAGGAAALVWAGVSEATATTVATATVSGGLLAGGAYGGYQTVVNTAQSAGAATVTGNWNPVAYNAGTLTGGFIVGTTPGILGDSSGGRMLADNMMDVMGQGPSQAPNTWNVGDILNYEIQNAYNPSMGPPGLNWLATSPTPFSGGAAATGIATGTGLFLQPSGTSSSSSQGDWLNPFPSSSSQSSSTGK